MEEGEEEEKEKGKEKEKDDDEEEEEGEEKSQFLQSNVKLSSTNYNDKTDL